MAQSAGIADSQVHASLREWKLAAYALNTALCILRGHEHTLQPRGFRNADAQAAVANVLSRAGVNCKPDALLLDDVIAGHVKYVKAAHTRMAAHQVDVENKRVQLQREVIRLGEELAAWGRHSDAGSAS